MLPPVELTRLFRSAVYCILAATLSDTLPSRADPRIHILLDAVALQGLLMQYHSALPAEAWSEQEPVRPVISVLWKEGGGEAVRLTESPPVDAAEFEWSGFIAHCTTEPPQRYEGHLSKEGARATRGATTLRVAVPSMSTRSESSKYRTKRNMTNCGKHLSNKGKEPRKASDKHKQARHGGTP